MVQCFTSATYIYLSEQFRTRNVVNSFRIRRTVERDCAAQRVRRALLHIAEAGYRRISSGNLKTLSTIRCGTMMRQQDTRDEPKRRMASMDDPWLSVRQAAHHAGVCEKTIRRAYLARQVQYTRVGRAVRFRRAWIDEWMLKGQVDAVA